jgi:glycine/D-amino acid oxidase-like deaminating enzyme
MTSALTVASRPPTDGLPFIGPHPHYPHHLFALGYGGNGMTFGFLAAQLLLEFCAGRQSRDQELFAFDRMGLTPKTAPSR